MKKILISLLLSIPLLTIASEPDDLFRPLELPSSVLGQCDACGCAASGASMGFGSLLESRFAGVRYIYQQYDTNDGLYSNSPWYRENYNSVQIWGRIPLTEKLQLSVIAPYHFNSRETATGDQQISGMGDISLMGLYRVLQTKSDSAYVFHSLQLGGGVKAPTGRYDELNHGSINPGFQLGTGSWDYLLLAEYTVKRMGFGFNAMANYVFKTTNDKGYHFGDQFNYAGTFFWIKEFNEFSFSPQAGIAGEISQANQQWGQEVDSTEGNILFSRIGLEAGWKRMSVGVNAMLPLTEDLTGGRVDARFRLGLNLNYSL